MILNNITEKKRKRTASDPMICILALLIKYNMFFNLLPKPLKYDFDETLKSFEN